MKKLLENEVNLRKAAEEEVSRLRHQLELNRQPNVCTRFKMDYFSGNV